MTDRRAFLLTILGAATVASSAAGLAAAMPHPSQQLVSSGLKIQRIGKLWLVNGWVLTDADREALGL